MIDEKELIKTIERAIEKTNKRPNNVYYSKEHLIMLQNKILETIKSQPQKRGKWIMHVDDLFPAESTQECSVCHEHETMSVWNDNYCGNCGAYMRGDENEDNTK